MTKKYRNEQHEEYFYMTERIGNFWLKIFDNDPDFYSAVYWDLLTRLWRARKPLRKTEAIKLMPTVSPATAGKHLEKAISKKLVCQTQDMQDRRIQWLELSQDLRDRLDIFLDNALEEIGKSYQCITKQIQESEHEDHK